MDDTKAVGEKLVKFCRSGLNLDAIGSLYSPDIVSVEAMGSAEMPAEMRGIEKIRGKNEWWLKNNEVHSSSADGPFPNQDRFAVIFDYDTTAKDGQMKGKRMKFHEVGLYTVKDGKIVREEFYYDMG